MEFVLNNLGLIIISPFVVGLIIWAWANFK